METRRMSLVKLSSQAAASLPNVGGAACISNLHNGHLEQTYANLVHLMLPFLFHMSSWIFSGLEVHYKLQLIRDRPRPHFMCRVYGNLLAAAFEGTESEMPHYPEPPRTT